MPSNLYDLLLQKEYTNFMDVELKILILIAALIFCLEAFALVKGVDGNMFGTSMVALGAVAGYVINSHVAKRKKR